MLQDKVDTYFKNPIFFSKNYQTLPGNIIDDLEILQNKDPSKNTAQNNIPTKALPTINDCDCQTESNQDKIINGK